MSQYPVNNTASSLSEAVNDLMSGPSSLGQNFEGMNAVGVSFVTQGAFSSPLTQTYLTGLPIDSQEVLPPQPGAVTRTDDPDQAQFVVYPVWNTLPGGLPIFNINPVTATGRQITVTVDTTNAYFDSQSPFVIGQQVVLSGITPSNYNGTYTVFALGAWFAPYIDVTLIQDTEETWGAYTSGGVAKINDDFSGLSPKTQRFFTGNQAVITVTGPTDRVFISSQINNLIVYTFTYVTAFPLFFAGSFVNLEIGRYRAVQKTTLPDIGANAIYSPGGTAYGGYLWEYDGALITVPTNIAFNLSTTLIDSNNFGDVIYNNIIDNPGIGTFLYAFQISQEALRDSATPDVRLIVGAQSLGVRSFTAQAIKR